MSTTAEDVRLTTIVLVVVLAITVSMVTATQGGAADFRGISMVAFSAILCFGTVSYTHLRAHETLR